MFVSNLSEQFKFRKFWHQGKMHEKEGDELAWSASFGAVHCRRNEIQ